MVTVPAGACIQALEVPVGPLTVTEVVTPASRLAACSTVPAADLVSCSPASSSATVTIKPGDVSTQTILTITNRPRKTP